MFTWKGKNFQKTFFDHLTKCFFFQYTVSTLCNYFIIFFLMFSGNPHVLYRDENWNSLLCYAVKNGAYIGCNLPHITTTADESLPPQALNQEVTDTQEVNSDKQEDESEG